MLQKVGNQIANCLAQAAEAERRATEASDEAIRIDNERLAKTWRTLANSYQFVESLDRFLLEADRRKGRRLSDNLDPALFEPDAPPVRYLRRVVDAIGPHILLRALAAVCHDIAGEVGICEPVLGLKWSHLASDLEKFDRARRGLR